MVRCVVARRSFGLVRLDLLLQIDPSASDPRACYILRQVQLDLSSQASSPSDSAEDPRGYDPSRSFPSE